MKKLMMNRIWGTFLHQGPKQTLFTLAISNNMDTPKNTKFHRTHLFQTIICFCPCFEISRVYLLVLLRLKKTLGEAHLTSLSKCFLMNWSLMCLTGEGDSISVSIFRCLEKRTTLSLRFMSLNIYLTNGSWSWIFRFLWLGPLHPRWLSCQITEPSTVSGCFFTILQPPQSHNS